MVQLRLHPRREQQLLLDACATSRPAPAAHLGGRRNVDEPISFADIRRLPEPEWADTNPASRAAFWPGRYTVGALVPPGQLAAVPLPTAEPEPEPLPAELLNEVEHERASRDVAFELALTDDRVASTERCEAIAAAVRTDDMVGAELAAGTAAVLDAVAARPGLRHNHALLVALAPIVARLKGLVA